MAHAASHASDPTPAPLRDAGVCLGRTCLAWEADGELRESDVHLILERLCRVDVQACQALQDTP
jgi:hypothetical protein